MVRKTSNQWHGCPIRFSSTVLGDEWAMLVLRDLMFKGRQYYGDFLDAGEGISTSILASRLLALENEGIITKATDPDKGSRIKYRLTQKGIDLVPAMIEMMYWALKWDKHTEIPDEFATDLLSDRAKLTRTIQDGLIESERN